MSAPDVEPDRVVVVVPYDPSWVGIYTAVAAELRAALGDRALEILHVGSTAVPDLAAKPVVDVVLLVDDSSDEAAYVDPLAARGFRLVVREPGWYEHRMLRRDGPSVNLHVYSAGCEEVGRLVRFRDRLRADAGDRELYAETKRRLAGRAWSSVDEYAAAKGAVVEEILARAAPPPHPA